MSDSFPLRCKCRRQSVTSLRCSRCFVPICPDCSTPAPVGMLCRECATNKPSRLYEVAPQSLGLAALASLATGLFCGWLLMGLGLSFGFFGLWGALGVGLAVGEVALRVTGRKRGLKMEILSGVSAALGILGGWALNGLSHGRVPTLEAFLFFFADPWHVLFFLIASGIAVARIRNI